MMNVSSQFPVSSFCRIDIRYSERRDACSNRELVSGTGILATELETGDWKLESDLFVWLVT